MAGAGTISQFADRIFPIGVFRFFMRAGFVILRVTAGAIGLVTCTRVSGCLTIALVTIPATDAGPMVSGIISR